MDLHVQETPAPDTKTATQTPQAVESQSAMAISDDDVDGVPLQSTLKTSSFAPNIDDDDDDIDGIPLVKSQPAVAVMAAEDDDDVDGVPLA